MQAVNASSAAQHSQQPGGRKVQVLTSLPAKGCVSVHQRGAQGGRPVYGEPSKLPTFVQVPQIVSIRSG